MTQLFQVHPEHPQRRLIRRAADWIRVGAVVVFPTDSTYAFGCHLGDKGALDRVRRIRRLEERHNFTLLCRDLSEIGTFAQLDNSAYRLLKAHTPGPYTFILKATREVPRRLMHPRRKTIGIRVPDHRIACDLLDALGEPLLTTTARLPGEPMPLTDPQHMRERLGGQVELILDGGAGGVEMTTVVDLVSGVPELMRVGKGPLDALLPEAGARGQ